MDRVIRRDRRWVGIVAALVCGLGCHAVQAATWPTIRAIDFAGNRVTRPGVLRRELFVHVGGPAMPKQVERSRQAILDLGLFNSVSVECKPVTGGVALTFRVDEKWYILPLPRVELNPDGDTGYGGQVRWNNVWGLNHTLKLLVAQRHYKEKDRSGEFTWQAAYAIPFIDGSPYGLTVSGGHANQDSIDSAGRHYREFFDNARVMLSRSLSHRPRTLGWHAGVGLSWQRENTRGVSAPPPQGKALGLVGSLSYNAMAFEVYGEHGSFFSVGYAHDFDGIDADYSASRYTLNYLRAWHVGAVSYQDVRLLVDVGLYAGGPRRVAPKKFSLGGGVRMRGYSSEFVQGDFSYYLGGEFLRPIVWNWLRGLAFVEVGSVYPRLGQTAGRPVYVDVGVGLRLRVVWLVNFDLQAGIAFPLIDDGSRRHWRLFAGS